MDYEAYLDKYIDLLNRIHRTFVAEAVEVIKQATHVYVCGNGGSSAIASHFVNDLVKIAGIPATSLTDNVPLLTAYANDIAYGEVFAQWVPAMRTTDVLVCISGSGMSANVLRAAYKAKQTGVTTIALIGQDGGQLYDLVSIPICIIGAKMTLAESAFSFICHMIAEGVIDEE